MRKMELGKTYTLTREELDEMSKNYDEFTEQLIAKGKVAVTAYFADWPGSAADKKCHKIFEQHDGEFLNCGTFIGDPTPERDVQFAVPMTKLKACKKALTAAGFRYEMAVVVH